MISRELYHALSPETEFETPFTLQVLDLPRHLYNTAATLIDNELHLLGREVPEVDPDDMHKPDVSPISMVNVTTGRTTRLWTPHGGDTLEDIRFNHDFTFAGATRVLKTGANDDGTDKHSAFISMITDTDVDRLLDGQFPPTVFPIGLGEDREHPALRFDVGIEGYVVRGKNITPIGVNANSEQEFLYRPEDRPHTFIFFTVGENNMAKNVQTVHIPIEDRPHWMKYNVGSTLSPVLLNNQSNGPDREYLFMIHGIEVVDEGTKDAKDEKFIYAIGSARLYCDEHGQYTVDNISREPLLRHDTFYRTFNRTAEELHSFRRVVYLLGGVAAYDALGDLDSLITSPQVGDIHTFLATLTREKIDALTRTWFRPERLSAREQLIR